MAILWPFGDAAPNRVAPAYAATIEVEVFDRLTIIDMPTLTGAPTLDLDIDAETPDGALLVINVDQGATGRNVTLGTGFVGDDLVGVANDKDTIIAQYSSSDGTFRVISIYKTVNAA